MTSDSAGVGRSSDEPRSTLPPSASMRALLLHRKVLGRGVSHRKRRGTRRPLLFLLRPGRRDGLRAARDHTGLLGLRSTTSQPRAGRWKCHLRGHIENQSPGLWLPRPARGNAHAPAPPPSCRRDGDPGSGTSSAVPTPTPRCAAPDKPRSGAETEISMLWPRADIKQKYTLLQAQCLSKKSRSYDSQKCIHLSGKYWLSALRGTRRRGPGGAGNTSPARQEGGHPTAPAPFPPRSLPARLAAAELGRFSPFCREPAARGGRRRPSPRDRAAEPRPAADVRAPRLAVRFQASGSGLARRPPVPGPARPAGQIDAPPARSTAHVSAVPDPSPPAPPSTTAVAPNWPPLFILPVATRGVLENISQT